MKTNRSFEAGLLPVYMQRAAGVKRDFMLHGKCRVGQHSLPREAWTMDRKDKALQGEEPETWIRLALTICQSCPVQYDCTRFALQVDERWGTWGVDIIDLQWMKHTKRGPEIIDAAEALGVSVHVAVRNAQGVAA